MKVIDRINLYSSLRSGRDVATLRSERNSAKKLLMEIKPKIIRNYPNEVQDYYTNSKDNFSPNLSAGDEFIDIFLLLKGDLKGKKILDLGCGSSDSEINKHDSYFSYSPWLCRLLHETEASPIGIDIQCNGKEKFENYVCDVYRENSLNFLPSNYIDIATTNALFDSPRLEQKYGRHAGKNLLKRLLPKLERIVKPEGVFVGFFD